jgi:flavin reductase (DIM6/NTAB) family NADH-FMN oxidoreductase RutF
MKTFDTSAIDAMAKIPRLNLINSVTGYKSANLIGTYSKDGILNVAIFSSITHLGSNPALLGFMIRPVANTPRDTYNNIKDNHYFTVNHITKPMIQDAHHTASAYDTGISEFDKTNLEPEFLDGHKAPFVQGSPVRLLCKFVNEYPIAENGCIHLIARIEKIYVEDKLLQKENWVRLDLAEVVTINGLDGYSVPNLIDRLAYARPDQPTKSML